MGNGKKTKKQNSDHTGTCRDPVLFHSNSARADPRTIGVGGKDNAFGSELGWGGS